jgi:hypothetical protein
MHAEGSVTTIAHPHPCVVAMQSSTYTAAPGPHQPQARQADRDLKQEKQIRTMVCQWNAMALVVLTTEPGPWSWSR